MERFLVRYSEFGYLVLRLGVAFLFIFHAPQKWFGWYGGPQWPLFSIRSLASLIETIVSPLIALGLYTPYAALLGAAEMVGAYLIVHIHVLPRPGWPIENRGETLGASHHGTPLLPGAYFSRNTSDRCKT
jgi:putative oxidoreductase